jgi:predicted ArsR family transcriptional regulator
MPSNDAAIDAIALLDEPARRALYDLITSRTDAVGRDEAAEAVGIGRALAAFHLDRMVRDGLLVAEYKRRSGRTGPGAGRPAKLYRRAPGTISVSLPHRDYEVAAQLLASAIERSSPDIPPLAASAAARDAGQEIGQRARQEAGPRARHARKKAALIDELRDRGYEPREEQPGEILLGNCPFDALVDQHRPLVCGMNLALAEGMLDGLGDDHLHAVLDQQPGRCCVTLHDEDPAAG